MWPTTTSDAGTRTTSVSDYVNEGREERDLTQRPCMVTGCRKPGRFILGVEDGTTTGWCIDHVDPDGIKYFRLFVDSIRDIVYHAETGSWQGRIVWPDE